MTMMNADEFGRCEKNAPFCNQTGGSIVITTMERTSMIRLPQALRLLLVAGAAVVFSGCAQVSLSQQRLVAKPEMSFDLTAQGHPPTNLMSQVEPGLASTAGAQAAGCTSCR